MLATLILIMLLITFVQRFLPPCWLIRSVSDLLVPTRTLFDRPVAFSRSRATRGENLPGVHFSSESEKP